ncbi:MAG: hypothetical protein AAFP13_02955 [Pseudomonadota bacterium]
MITAIAQRLRQVWQDTAGSLTVETLICLPFLLWCPIATLVLFDVYHEDLENERVAHAFGDLLSRETSLVTDDYLSSFTAMHGFITDSRGPAAQRVTIVGWDDTTSTYEVRWSRMLGSNKVNAPFQDMTSTMLNTMPYTSRLPQLEAGRFFVLTETWKVWVPPLNAVLGPREIYSSAITRPRMSGQICFSPNGTQDATQAVC